MGQDQTQSSLPDFRACYRLTTEETLRISPLEKPETSGLTRVLDAFYQCYNKTILNHFSEKTIRGKPDCQLLLVAHSIMSVRF